MISIKIERVIFIVFLICMILVFGTLSTEYKLNQLSINADMTPEELIDNAYTPAIQSSYKIIYDNMFVVVGNGSSEYGQFDKACKINSQSGFLFEMPGLFRAPLYNTKTKTLTGPGKDIITVLISQFKNTYTVEIWDYKKNNSLYYIDGKIMDTLTLDSIVDCESIAVLDDLSADAQIYGMQNGQKYDIINSREINELF